MGGVALWASVNAAIALKVGAFGSGLDVPLLGLSLGSGAAPGQQAASLLPSAQNPIVLLALGALSPAGLPPECDWVVSVLPDVLHCSIDVDDQLRLRCQTVLNVNVQLRRSCCSAGFCSRRYRSDLDAWTQSLCAGRCSR